MSEVNWDELEEGFGRVEEEWASDPRDAGAIAKGVPVWAYGLYQDMCASWETSSAEDPDGTCPLDQAQERFVEGFVATMERAGVRVSWDGERTGRPSRLDGKATVEMNGWGLFRLFMALRVAGAIVEKMGPMALMGAGLIPNMEDAADIVRVSEGLATVCMSVCCEEGTDVGRVVDARGGQGGG